MLERNLTMNDESVSVDFRQLSDAQERILAVLPIPSATLSIVGSSLIIYMVFRSRQVNPLTPYNRILLAMSVCDIISSVTFGAASFLYPKQTSRTVWAMGNDATCSGIGLMNQFSYSGVLYNAMLSFYFLLTTKFGYRNQRIAQRVEPSMHFLSLGYPAVTAVFGLLLNAYGERPGNLGCWVARCEFNADGTQKNCESVTISIIFGIWVIIFALASLIVNNIVILYNVRHESRLNQQMKQKQKESSEEARNDVFSNDEGSLDLNDIAHPMPTSMRTIPPSSMKKKRKLGATERMISDRERQVRRLKLVSSQASFFVGSYLLCNAPTYIVRVVEAKTRTYDEHIELPYDYFPLLVFQALLLPLQGLLNMLVYIRPKYIKNRSECPEETRMSAFRNAIFTSTVSDHSIKKQEDIEETESIGYGEMSPPKNAPKNQARANMHTSWFNFDFSGFSENNHIDDDTAIKPDTAIPAQNATSLPAGWDTVEKNSQLGSSGSSELRDSAHAKHHNDSDAMSGKQETAGKEEMLSNGTRSGNTSLSLMDVMAYVDDAPNDLRTSDRSSDFNHMMNTGWSNSEDSLPRAARSILMDGSIHQIR